MKSDKENPMMAFITIAVAALLAACSSSKTPPPVPYILVHSDATCDITGLVHPAEKETTTIHGTQCVHAPLGPGLTASTRECGYITCVGEIGMQTNCQTSARMDANCPIRDFDLPYWTIRDE